MWQLLKRFLLAAAIILGGEVMVLAASRLTYHDPLAPYHTIMPGQPTDTAKKISSCNRQLLIINPLDNVFCTSSAEDGPVNEVILTSANDTVASTVFIIKPGALLLGDLVQ